MTFIFAAAFGALMATGVIHAVLGLRRPFAMVHLAFALMAACLSAFMFLQLELYHSQTAMEGVELVRVQARVVTVQFLAFGWFACESLGVRKRPAPTALFVGFLVAALLYNESTPYGLYYAERPALLRSRWFGEEISSLSAHPGPVQIAWYAFGILVFASVAFAGVRLLQRRVVVRGLALAAGGVLLVAAFGMDFFHEQIGGTWPYVTEFAVTAFALLMSVVLAVTARAQEFELTRLAETALVVRDKLNTPLQSLAVGINLLEKGGSPRRLIPYLRRAMDQLAELGRVLRPEKPSAELIREVVTPRASSATPPNSRHAPVA